MGCCEFQGIYGRGTEVWHIAEFAFHYRVDEYYAHCVGCKIMCNAVMDNHDYGHDSEQIPVPENLSSWVFETQFFVKAEHSFLAKNSNLLL
jgi:hypothetical protein